MNESDLIRVYDRYRLAVLEQLCIAQALSIPVLAGELTAEQSLQVLLQWLDTQIDKSGEVYGAHFREPGMTALHSEEARRAIEKMKGIAEKVAQALKGSAPE